ncbi:hypothetical protein CUMW_148030 [Citrus unshiu]|uniref:Secreted protein n=1 Tax=Citrus unshiu TaxID=55188 RepID=A0A2H5PME4_CITUN|nr:hypothetical protein CUMW_148030 [Citrus unshiu]GAY53275.1 hypothetical protein CUMW_148030 [Citrus unshiu]
MWVFMNIGCLLRSLPADVVFDNITGYSFTCDLTDNIAAPWPASSSASSLSLCAPEMSLPALPTSETLKNPGICNCLCFFLYELFLFCFHNSWLSRLRVGSAGSHFFNFCCQCTIVLKSFS